MTSKNAPKRPKKLQLGKDTLRRLDDREAATVAGGAPPTGSVERAGSLCAC
jgi:hypothetical protein